MPGTKLIRPIALGNTFVKIYATFSQILETFGTAFKFTPRYGLICIFFESFWTRTFETALVVVACFCGVARGLF